MPPRKKPVQTKAKKPVKKGAKWTEEEVNELIEAWEDGIQTPASIKKACGWDSWETQRVKSKVQELVKSGVLEKEPGKENNSL